MDFDNVASNDAEMSSISNPSLFKVLYKMSNWLMIFSLSYSLELFLKVRLKAPKWEWLAV